MATSAFGEDFGQQVKLTATIRSILRSYPEGTSILKELIQNADDAGARRIAFCLDARTHRKEAIAAEALAQFQGPALLAFNDAQFTKADFESIQRLGDSLKKASSKGTKTGRFGIGFNSVYHLTDLPSFVSSKYLVMFDPQARFLPNVNPANPGKMVNFVDNAGVINSLSDQFVPYRAFGCDFTREYPHTLFRLPLRTPEQAESSELSNRSHNVAAIADLLQELQQEAVAMLLFLKRIEAISIYQWHESDEEPTVMFECSIRNMTPALRRQRELIALQNPEPDAWRQPRACDYTLEVLSVEHGAEKEGKEEEEKSKLEVWEVCNQLGGGQAAALASSPELSYMRFVPWAGVAAKVVGPTDAHERLTGLAFCFLPLPAKTGLGVHVNGYFELSTNRRDIWTGEDMSGDGRLRAEWNVALLQDVVAPSYLRLLERIKVAMGFSLGYQQLWPTGNLVSPWDKVQDAVMQNASHHELLCSIRGDGGLTWVTAKQAVLMPDVADGRLLRILTNEDVCVIDATPELRSLLLDFNAYSSLATPQFVRNQLRMRCNGENGTGCYNAEDTGFLLEYCLQSLPNDRLEELDRLPLLPLQDGSVGRFAIFSTDQRTKIDQIVQLGFSVATAAYQLQQSGWNFEAAVARVLEGQDNSEPGTDDASFRTFVICDEAESQLFERANCMLVDSRLLGAKERQLLQSRPFQAASNVASMKPELIPVLASVVLPSAWRGLERIEVELSSYESGWLLQLWRYMASDEKRIRAVAEKIPVIPTVGSRACVLSRRLKLLVGEALPEPLQRMLEMVGVNIVSASLFEAGIAVSPHVWEYFYQSSREGVLAVLDVVLRDQHGLEALHASSATQRVELFRFLAHSEPVRLLNADGCRIARQLPIYPTFDFARKTNVVDAPLTDLADGSSHMVLRSQHKIDSSLIGPQFLRCSDLHEKELLLRLGACDCSSAQFYVDFVLPRGISVDDVADDERKAQFDEAVGDMLAMLPQLDAEERELRQKLSGLPFARAANGVLRKPTVLFDPDVLEFRGIVDEAMFPTPLFHRPDMLTSLRSLGLQRNVGWDTVLLCARALDADSTRGSELAARCHDRGLRLLRLLDKEAQALLGEPEKAAASSSSPTSFMSLFKSAITTTSKPKDKSTAATAALPASRAPPAATKSARFAAQLAELMSLRWVPVLPSLPEEWLPYHLHAQEQPLACPSECALLAEAPFCSSCRFIIAADVNSPKLRSALGWDVAASASVVAQQLKQIAVKYSAASNAPHASVELDDFRQMISATVPRLYQRLEAASGSTMDSVRDVLFGQEWIWVGERFITAEQAAFSSAVDASPFLYTIPADLTVFSTLLRSFGVRTQFTAVDYRHVLTSLAETCTEPGTDRRRPLNTREFELAIALVHIVADDQHVRQADEVIFVPDNRGILAPAKQLVYDDAPWLAEEGGTQQLLQFHFCHPTISAKVGNQLGMRSLRLQLVAQNTSQLEFSIPQSEAFGQAESLTRRLRNILDMYAAGLPTISELVQNADDAGAKTVRILYSQRRFGEESLLGMKMASWQGPALYVFNDAVFQESDFKNVARIGQGSKLDKVDTTGRFGLGFNAVYHLTDLPSFVSGDSIVMFDPHTAYLPGATLVQPGIKIKFTGTNIVDQFRDQFAPYLLFGCDMRKRFQGTLFRFPLRTTATARDSEISKTCFAHEDVMSLLDTLRGTINNYLLFVRSLMRIEVYVQLDDESPARLMFAADRSVELAGAHPAAQSSTLLSTFIASDSQHVQEQRGHNKDRFYVELMSTPDSRLPFVVQKIDIRHQHVSDDRSLATTRQQYLVVSGFGGGKAKAIACDERYRHLKFIPWGGVAALVGAQRQVIAAAAAAAGSEDAKQGELILTADEQALSQFEGHAFCFLPLPVDTALPVHVNGYFELSSNRRDIWYGEDMAGEGQLRSEWNTRLMLDVIAPLYVQLLQQLKGAGVSPAQLQFVLPSRPANRPWHTVQERFLALLKDEEICWSEVDGGRFVSPAQAVIAEVQTAAAPSERRVIDMLLAQHVPVVVLHKFLAAQLVAQQCVRGELGPLFVREYLKSIGSRATPFSHDDGLFLLGYCTRDLQTKSAVELIGIPLLPLENGTFGTFEGSASAAYFLIPPRLRSILRPIAGRIVADLEKLDQHIASLLADPHMAEISNVRPITPAEVVELIGSVLPAQWRDASVEVVDPRDCEFLTEAWLGAFWKFLVDQSAFGLMKNGLPLLPVLGPGGERSAFLLTRLSDQSRVLQPARIPLSPELHAAFDAAGLRMLYDRPLGPVAVNEQFLSQFQACDARGVLLALSGDDDATSFQRLQELPRACAAALRTFLFDQTTTVEFANDEKLQQVLRSLPIWEVFPDYRRVALQDGGFRVAPDDFDARLLDSSFIVVQTSRQRRALLTLQVQDVPLGKLYENCFVRKIEQFASDPVLLESTVMHILRELHRLRTDHPSLVDSLRDCAFVPNCNEQRYCARDLFDPEESELVHLLPDDSFPHRRFCDRELLYSLRMLGLQTALSCDGVLQSARSIEAQSDAGDSQLSAALHRSANLARYLDQHVRRLLQEADPEYLQLYDNMNAPVSTDAEQPDEESSLDAPTETGPSARAEQQPQQRLAGGEFGKQLRDIRWLPAHVTPPLPLLPWPSEQQLPVMATPALTRPVADQWAVSSVLRLARGSIDSNLVRSLLGWHVVVSGEVVAQQLLALAKQHRDASAPEQEALATIYRQEIGTLYRVLQEQCEAAPGESRSASILAKLRNTPCVFVGDRFAEPYRVAFAVDPGVTTRPFLFELPGEFGAFSVLFRKLGVRDRFSAVDYTGILADMAHAFQGVSLPPQQLNLALGVVKLITSLPPAERDVLRASRTTLFAPSQEAVMLPSEKLTFNDAAWLGPSLPRNAGLVFAHEGIDQEAAAVFNIPSLREKLFTGNSIVCPPAERVKQLLGQDGLADAFRDVVALADAVGVSGIHFCIDQNTYLAQSLLHPGLAPLQGPALLICLEGAVLSSQDVVRLVASPLEEERSANPYFPVCSKGLLSTFSVCDVLQVLTGSEFFIFDPLGQHLMTGEEAASPGGLSSRPIAQQCNIKAQNVLRRFPDQFEPFLNLPFGLRAGLQHAGHFYGTVLRLPLRAQPSALAEAVWRLEADDCGTDDGGAVERLLMSVLEPALLFGRNVRHSTFYHIAADAADAPELVFELRDRTQAQHRQARFQLTQSTDWRPRGLGALFRSFQPTSLEYVAHLAIRRSGSVSEELVQEWRVCHLLGAGRTRDLALSMMRNGPTFVPMVAVAARISAQDLGDLDTRLPEGQLSVGGACVASTGLQVHVDAPVLVERDSRQWRTIPSGRQAVSNASLLSSSSSSSSSSTVSAAEWNQSLLNVVLNDIMPAVLLHLQRMLGVSGSPTALYKYWVYSCRLVNPLKQLLLQSEFHARVAKMPLFWSGREFVPLDRGVVAFKQLPPEIVQLLQQTVALLQMPQSAAEDLMNAPRIHVKVCDAGMLRRLLNSGPLASLLRALLTANPQLCCDLLRVCVSDILSMIADGQAVDASRWRQLCGLPLLYTEAGTVVEIPAHESQAVIAAGVTQSTLFARLTHRVVHSSMVAQLSDLFALAPFHQHCHVMPFNANTLGVLLEELLPARWKGATAVEWDPERPDHPSREFVFMLWQEVSFGDPLSVASLKDWPLIPVEGSTLLSCALLPYVQALQAHSPAELQSCASIQAAVTAEVSAAATVVDTRLSTRHDTSRGDGDAWAWTTFTPVAAAMPTVMSISTSEVPRVQGQVRKEEVEDDSVLEEKHEEVAAQDTENASPAERSSQAPHGSGGGGGSSQIVWALPAHRRTELNRVLTSMGMPMIDRAIITPENLAHLVTRDVAVLARRLLNSLATFQETQLKILLSDAATSAPLCSWAGVDASGRLLMRSILVAAQQSNSPLTAAELDAVKFIPIFQNLEGAWVAIRDCEQPCVRCSQTSAACQVPLPPAARSKILLDTSDSQHILAALNIPVLGLARAVSQFLIPAMAHMSLEDIVASVKYIKNQWQHLKSDGEIVTLLRSTACVPVEAADSESGMTLRAPEELFDYRNEHMRSLLSDDPQYFPHPSIRTAEWARFLSDVGMRNDLDKPLFLRFVRDVERLALVDMEEAYKRAVRLIGYLADGDASAHLYDTQFCKDLKDIACVPVLVPEGMAMGGHVTFAKSLVKFSDVAAPTTAPLVFSVLPVLASDLAPPQLWFSKLGIIAAPPTEAVLRHFRHLMQGAALERWNWPAHSPTEVFEAIYRFLWERWNDLSVRVRQGLQEMNCVLVGDRTVRASRVFFRLTEDLSPFVFEVPRVFGAHEQFLRAVGVQDAPTPAHYAQFLADLAQEAATNPLNPNELRAVIKVVGAACTELDRSVADHPIDLFIPDATSVLRSSRQCVSNNAPWLLQRIRLSTVFVVHPLISHDICEKLRVPRLSDVVHERLAPGFNPVAPEMVDFPIMRTGEFALAIRALQAHQQHTSSATGQAGADSSPTLLAERAIEERLQMLTIQRVQQIQSEFVLQDKRRSAVARTNITGRAEGTLVLSDSHTNVMYISTQDAPPSVTVEYLVATGIVRALGLPDEMAGTVSCLLPCREQHQLEEVLEKLQVYPDQVAVMERLRGAPGELVNAMDRALLELKPLRAFAVGEVVAWSDAQAQIRYGVVVAIEPANDATSLQSLVVRTGAGTTRSFLTSELYTFRAAREAAAAASARSSTEQGLALKLAEHDTVSETKVEVEVVEENDDRRSVSGHNGGQSGPAASSAAAPVGQATLLSAVQDLLSKANLPLSLEAKEHMQRAVELEQRTALLQQELRDEAERSRELKRRLDDASSALRCQICLSSPVNVCLAPCGHLICRSCDQSMHRRNCPFCRAQIRMSVPFLNPFNDDA